MKVEDVKKKIADAIERGKREDETRRASLQDAADKKRLEMVTQAAQWAEEVLPLAIQTQTSLGISQFFIGTSAEPTTSYRIRACEVLGLNVHVVELRLTRDYYVTW